MKIVQFDKYMNAKTNAVSKTDDLLNHLGDIIDREYSDEETKAMLKREISKANEEFSKTFYELELAGSNLKD